MIKTQSDLLQFHEELCDNARDIMHQKNDDYADADHDPFLNFREFGKDGIIVRLSDKWQRLKNFHKRGRFSVQDESLKDVAVDMINYLILYLAYPTEGGQEKGGGK